MKKWWVKLFVVFAVVLLAISMWFFNSGSDSKTRLERYQKQLLAAGEKLDIDAYIPPRADSDKNGAEFINEAFTHMAPVGASMVNTNPPAAMCIVAPGKAKAAWPLDEVISLRGNFFKTNTWADLEGDLSAQSAAFDFLQEAATRPEFDFGVEYRQPYVPMPQLQKLRQATALLAAKVIFDQHRGDTASAVTNFQTLLVIANASKDEPTVGSQNIRTFFLQSVVAAQWDLLQSTNITDEQLAACQKGWTNIDFIKPMEKAETFTRSIISVFMEEGRAGRPLGGSGGPGPRMSGPFDIGGLVQSIRRGAGDALWRQSWSYDDELTVVQGYQLMVETLRQAETNGYFKDALAERDRKITALGLNHTNENWLRKRLNTQYAVVGTEFIHSISSIVDRVAVAEAWRQCAITAIALKRYQLRHGTLPKELSGLVPELLPELPRDPIDGKPLRYHPNPDGTFLLYSIGTNGVDDGGDATPIPPETSWQWQTAHDWVWPQPATPLEIQNYYAHPPK